MADREALDDALASLPGAFREALLLVVVDGLTPAEAAQFLGVAHGTVLSRVHRARRLLRARLLDGNRTGDSG